MCVCLSVIKLQASQPDRGPQNVASFSLGRRCPEGADEGADTSIAAASSPSPVASRHPLPFRKRKVTFFPLPVPGEESHCLLPCRSRKGDRSRPSPWGEGAPKGRMRGLTRALLQYQVPHLSLRDILSRSGRGKSLPSPLPFPERRSLASFSLGRRCPEGRMRGLTRALLQHQVPHLSLRDILSRSGRGKSLSSPFPFRERKVTHGHYPATKGSRPERRILGSITGTARGLYFAACSAM